MTLGDALIAAGKLAPSQVRRALVYQARHRVRFGEACILQGLVPATELLPTLAGRLRVPWVFLGTRTVPDAVLAQVPGPVMRRERVMPIRVQYDERGRTTVFIATAEPQNLALLDALSLQTGKGIRAVLACSLDLHRALERHGILDGRIPRISSSDLDAGFTVQRPYATA